MENLADNLLNKAQLEERKKATEGQKLLENTLAAYEMQLQKLVKNKRIREEEMNKKIVALEADQERKEAIRQELLGIAKTAEDDPDLEERNRRQLIEKLIKQDFGIEIII